MTLRAGGGEFWTRDADKVEEGEFTGNESTAEGYRYHDSASFTPPPSTHFPPPSALLVTLELLPNLFPGHNADTATQAHRLSLSLSRVCRALGYRGLNGLRSHPPSPHARHNAISFLTAAVGRGDESQRLVAAPLVASAAVEIGAPALYKTAIEEAIRASKGDSRGTSALVSACIVPPSVVNRETPSASAKRCSRRSRS